MAETNSEKYLKVKTYYDQGFWTASQVNDAVTKGWITSQEAQEILDQSK